MRPKYLFILLLLLLFSSDVLHAQKHYTAFNIWYRDRQGIITLNYKDGTMLPAGTAIDQVRHGRDRQRWYLSFRVVHLKARFAIFFWKKHHPNITINDFRARAVSTKTFEQMTEGMTQWEIQNIKAGKVMGGMSKKAVLMTYGLPPDSRTPNLSANSWIYYLTRARTRTVEFASDGYSNGLGPDGNEYAHSGKEPDKEVKQQVVVANQSKDTTPPRIEVFEPAQTRGVRIVSTEKLMIRGKASDESGITRVIINGYLANVSVNGDFWAEALLKGGQNSVTIKAEDLHGNSAEKKFSVNLQTKTIAAADQGSGSTGAEIEPGRYYAMLIGIQDYNDPNIPDLDQPVSDARSIRDVLLSTYAFNAQDVYLLENPDRRDIYAQFESLSRNITKEDNLLIFYAGHGYWDEQFQQGYWLPSNASKSIRSEWISNPDIVTFIRGIQSKHTLLISDACFSGAILKKRSLDDGMSKAIRSLYKLPSRVAMTSGTMTEVPDRSVFIEFLVKRLEQNQTKFLAAGKLFYSLQEAVSSNSALEQVPQYSSINRAGHEGGDFIFVKK